MKNNGIWKLIPRIVVALILLQTLYFKFGIGGEAALNESKEIFGLLSKEIFGSESLEAFLRIGTGIAELISAILILLPGTAHKGAILAVLLMGGAILSHIFFLGIEVRNDGGQLFALAFITLIAALKVIFDERKHLI